MHDALLTLGYITEKEFAKREYGRWQEQLEKDQRLVKLNSHPNKLWIATELFPLLDTIFSELSEHVELPELLLKQEWTEEKALIEIVSVRL